MKNRMNQILLLSVSCLLLSACNNESDFYQKQGSIFAATEVGVVQDNAGEDLAPILVPKDPSGLCSQISSADSCRRTEGCQPLYSDDVADASFIGCIASLPPEVSEPKAGAPVPLPRLPEPSAGEEVDDDSPQAPAAPAPLPRLVQPEAPAAPSPEAPAPAPAPAAPSAPAAPAPAPAAPSAPAAPAPAPAAPSAPAVSAPAPAAPGSAIPSSCAGVNPNFLSGSKGQQKVMICHNSAKASHSIVISCSALSTHVSHHGDSLGACSSNQ